MAIFPFEWVNSLFNFSPISNNTLTLLEYLPVIIAFISADHVALKQIRQLEY